MMRPTTLPHVAMMTPGWLRQRSASSALLSRSALLIWINRRVVYSFARSVLLKGWRSDAGWLFRGIEDCGLADSAFYMLGVVLSRCRADCCWELLLVCNSPSELELDF